MTLTQEKAFALLRDHEWRLNNLYKIKNKEGLVEDFKPNWAQVTLLNPHNLNIILKARQLGITTLHALIFLDKCLFEPNTNAAIVADNKDVAKEIFVDKVKFAYDNLPEFIRRMVPAYRDNANEMRFANGSVFRVATSLRGGTIQLLHITEFAKVCQENPHKADEIISGAINAVQAGQFICIESTARGRDGHFYNLCKKAKELQDTQTELDALDWKLWFFPWWKHPDYILNSKNLLINKELEDYFKNLESQDIFLNQEQKAWYIKKMQTQGDYMKREYPSTMEEAFETANEGYYFAKQITQARQERRVCNVPYDANAKTFTSWDIGIGDTNAIWVFQVVGKEIHCIDHYENSDEAIAHYIKWLKEKPYVYEKHFMPHDAASRSLQTGKSLVDIARGMGMKVDVVPRDTNEMFGIECLRSMLNRFYFDQHKCAKGIKALENFRKEWNEKLGCYREKSMHDWASHSAKALIYAAESIQKMGNSAGLSAEEWARLRKEWL